MKTNESKTQHLYTNPDPISKGTQEQYAGIVHNLKKQDINQIKQREEYVLFKEIVSLNFTEDSNSGNTIDSKNPVNTVIEGSGVNPSFCTANVVIDTSNNKRSLYFRQFIFFSFCMYLSDMYSLVKNLENKKKSYF